MTSPSRPPLVMGVLNITPNSFSDGGKFASRDHAIAHALEMIEQGADLIDVGGESTKPGSVPVDAEEQIHRIVPVIEALRDREIVMSVDTMSAIVAQAAVESGAAMINDISAGRFDVRMLALAADRKIPIVLMHMLGSPATMQDNPRYTDVVSQVVEFLSSRVKAALEVGIARENILVDPGIGFGKTIEHNLSLLRETGRIASETGAPVVVGPSRKSFIGTITHEPEPAKRVFGTAASVSWAISNGASVVRVHDVGPMKQVVQMIDAIVRGRADKPAV